VRSASARSDANRNGFYVLLLLFIAALALLPAALPVVMLVAAAGMHAYWLGRVLHRLAHRGQGARTVKGNSASTTWPSTERTRNRTT
jgi:predicted PurR-regulated permease PerM